VQPCKLYFGEPGIAGRRGWQRGEDTRTREKEVKSIKTQGARKGVQGGRSVTTTTDSTTPRNVWSSLCRRGGPGKSAQRSHVLPFYRGICSSAARTHSSCHTRCRWDTSSLAGLSAAPRASASLRAVEAVFSEGGKRRQRQHGDKTSSQRPSTEYRKGSLCFEQDALWSTRSFLSSPAQ